MDDHMLFGCSGFVATSVGCYLLAAWPFFIWLDVSSLRMLATVGSLGLPVAFVIGALSGWKFGLAGSAGFVCGMVAVAVFLYLRLEYIFVGAIVQQNPEPEYPVWTQWFLPAMVVALAVVMSAIVLSFFNDRSESEKKP